MLGVYLTIVNYIEGNERYQIMVSDKEYKYKIDSMRYVIDKIK